MIKKRQPVFEVSYSQGTFPLVLSRVFGYLGFMQQGMFAAPQVKETLIGHTKTLAFLARAAAADKLAHAYLFVGPEHVGKMTAALDFASTLLHTATPATHPDFTLVERGRDAKTGKLHGTIVLEQIHALTGRLALGAFLTGYKICVIDGAQLLTPEAANALLKTLEEPRPKTILLLLATSDAEILPTIRSRCQVMRFGRVATQEIAAQLARSGTAKEKALLYARLSAGLPGKAISYAEDPKSLDALFSLRDTLLHFPELSVAERFATIEKRIPAKTSFQEAGDRAIAMLDLSAELIRDALLIAAGRSDAITHIDARDSIAVWANAAGTKKLAAAAEEIAETRRLIDANVNPRTALERFVLSF